MADAAPGGPVTVAVAAAVVASGERCAASGERRDGGTADGGTMADG
ncbi:hypothetical protein [Streptomyces hygroscopicus]